MPERTAGLITLKASVSPGNAMTEAITSAAAIANAATVPSPAAGAPDSIAGTSMSAIPAIAHRVICLTLSQLSTTVRDMV